ncbi:MAG: M15 family metallopeptidase [Ruminococcus sp.]|nr:M15 family metallopeptidase [Ruminococcus sp.]
MDYLILIDALHPVPWEVYTSLELKEVSGILLEVQAAEHLGAMLEKARDEGIEIKALSGFRSISYQQGLWERAVARAEAGGMTQPEAVALVSETLAKPRHSEHNCGLAADLCTPAADDTEENFCTTSQGKWLAGNAAEYGFILRYPRMKEHLTGIAYEPWHYRYVGSEAAELIKSSGLCLEEFLHFYSDDFYTARWTDTR